MDSLRIKELISKYPTVISTCDVGQPNISVAMDVDMIDDETIIISHNEMKQTIENVKNNENICLLILNDDKEGIRVFGKAGYYDDGEYLKYVIDKFKNERTNPLGAIVIKIETAEKIS